jgi:hypothetical protein
MEVEVDLWRRIIIGTIGAVVCAALVGGIYFWYEWISSTNSFDNNLNSVASAPTPASSTSPLGASQQALRQSAQASASTTASPAALQASQAALEKAAQNNSTSSDSSAAQQTQLEASQAALEKAVQQSKGQ